MAFITVSPGRAKDASEDQEENFQGSGSQERLRCHHRDRTREPSFRGLGGASTSVSKEKHLLPITVWVESATIRFYLSLYIFYSFSVINNPGDMN